MGKPLVAVVGRPNVGKSTFINRVCGKRVSIVKDIAGVTRDRLYVDCQWCSRAFTLIDTGGIDDGDDDIIKNVRRQAFSAVELCDVVIFITDGKQGVVPADFDVADILRRSKKPVVVAVNKLDNFGDNPYDFYQLGLGETFGISCEQGIGVGDLLDKVCSLLPPVDDSENESALKIALVGKPNVGKSSIVNKLLGFDRVIVSDVAGTTRDAIDTPFTYEGKDYILIDTAGMRRKREIEYDSIESYSVLRAISAIRRADIVLCVMDSNEPVTEQDVKIAGLVHEEGKPSVIVMNKWDSVEGKDAYTVEKKKNELDIALAFMNYYKVEFVSALTGQRINKLLSAANASYENASRRITTGILNEIIGAAVAANAPPVFSGKRLKIYYSSQISTCPPVFVIKVNNPKLIHFSFERYIVNCLRRAADFSGTPIKVKFESDGEQK